jgi:hypothetical protein
VKNKYKIQQNRRKRNVNTFPKQRKTKKPLHYLKSPVRDVSSKSPRKRSMASYRIEEISVSEMPWAMINLLVKIKKGMSHDENAVGNLSLW